MDSGGGQSGAYHRPDRDRRLSPDALAFRFQSSLAALLSRDPLMKMGEPVPEDRIGAGQIAPRQQRLQIVTRLEIAEPVDGLRPQEVQEPQLGQLGGAFHGGDAIGNRCQSTNVVNRAVRR